MTMKNKNEKTTKKRQDRILKKKSKNSFFVFFSSSQFFFFLSLSLSLTLKTTLTRRRRLYDVKTESSDGAVRPDFCNPDPLRRSFVLFARNRVPTKLRG
jgi:hypothetical protein